MPRGPTYFGELSRDEVGVICRQLSGKPRSAEWQGWVEDSNLRLLFDARSPLLSAAQNVFRKLLINSTLERDGVRVDGLAAPDCLPELLTSCVEHVALQGHSSLLAHGDLLDQIECTCRGLRSLKLTLWESMASSDKLQKVVRSQASVLEELSISQHSPGYILGGLSLPRLRSLHLSSCFMDNAVQALSACTDCLEEIAVTGMRGASATKWSAVMSVVRIHCRNATRVLLKDEPRHIPQEEHAALLATYGERLQRAQLSNLDESTMQQVLERCPNVTCIFSVQQNTLLGAFGVVAPRITKLTLSDVTASGQLQSAIQSCGKVKELSFRLKGTDSSALLSTFSEPRPPMPLKELIIHATLTVLSSQLTDRIAACTRDLRLLNLAVSRFDSTAALCELIASAPLLDTLKCRAMVFFEDEEGAVSFGKSVLMACRDLHVLKHLSVDFRVVDELSNRLGYIHDAIKGSVGFFRLQRIHMEICGKEYW